MTWTPERIQRVSDELDRRARYNSGDATWCERELSDAIDTLKALQPELEAAREIVGVSRQLIDVTAMEDAADVVSAGWRNAYQRRKQVERELLNAVEAYDAARAGQGEGAQ